MEQIASWAGLRRPLFDQLLDESSCSSHCAKITAYVIAPLIGHPLGSAARGRKAC